MIGTTDIGDAGASTSGEPIASTAAPARQQDGLEQEPGDQRRVDDALAFRTAKSRTRSSAVRYTIDAMIPAATNHSSTG